MSASSDEPRGREEMMEELMMKPSLSVEEVCQLYGFSPYLVRQAVRHGELRGTIVDHHIHGIRRDDLIMWLKERAGL